MRSTLLLHVLVGLAGPAIAEIEMEFTKSPESVTAPVGDEVTFECAVRVPGETLAWRWRPENDDWANWHNVNGTSDKDNVSTRLVVQVKTDTLTALYQCVVWYGAISLVSIPARLSIAKVDLSSNTQERRVITAPLYNTVVLHCKEPLSEPPARLSWWKETSKGARKTLDTPHGVLVINNATVEDSGTYGCVATNDISDQSVDLPERTYLKIQHEGRGGIRFLETEDFVGTIDKEGVLTQPVMPDNALRLWCGVVGTPPPIVTWSKDIDLSGHAHNLVVELFNKEHEGVYSCSTNGIRRSWKVIALQPPHWEGSAGSVSASEGSEARINCGTPHGQPVPTVHWVLNAELIKTGKGIKATDTELHIEHVEKRHAGIVQCFACNSLGCSYDAALLTVVPVQISDQDYSAETPKTQHIPAKGPRRHNGKNNNKKYKVVLIPPSRPNVTRLSDESVMVSWSHDNHGLPIQFFKVQYREVTNSTNFQWHTENYDIPAYIHSYEIDGLTPDKYYKFRIAAVYSNQDNKLGRSSAKFYLQKGGFQSPSAAVLDKATALSPHSIQINWTWSSHGGVEAEGFYVYYRAVSSAGAYEKVTASGSARSLVLAHLAPDTAYELKIQAYSAQAPSDFSAILMAKTVRPLNTASTSTEASAKEEERGPPTLVTAGGAAGAALLLVLVVTLVLCRRARRPTAGKEKASAEGGANGYLPAKVPITITANPMHGESGEGGVEMPFLHNNNCGNTTGSDDNLQHSRKSVPSRQYV